MVLNSLSTLLSEDPIAMGLEMVLNLVLVKKQKTMKTLQNTK